MLDRLVEVLHAGAAFGAGGERGAEVAPQAHLGVVSGRYGRDGVPQHRYGLVECRCVTGHAVGGDKGVAEGVVAGGPVGVSGGCGGQRRPGVGDGFGEVVGVAEAFGPQPARGRQAGVGERVVWVARRADGRAAAEHRQVGVELVAVRGLL